MNWALTPWATAQDRACHSGENTAMGQKAEWDGASVCQASSATGGVICGPTHSMRSSASAGPSTSTQSGW